MQKMTKFIWFSLAVVGTTRRVSGETLQDKVSAEELAALLHDELQLEFEAASILGFQRSVTLKHARAEAPAQLVRTAPTCGVSATGQKYCNTAAASVEAANRSASSTTMVTKTTTTTTTTRRASLQDLVSPAELAALLEDDDLLFEDVSVLGLQRAAKVVPPAAAEMTRPLVVPNGTAVVDPKLLAARDAAAEALAKAQQIREMEARLFEEEREGLVSNVDVLAGAVAVLRGDAAASRMDVNRLRDVMLISEAMLPTDHQKVLSFLSTAILGSGNDVQKVEIVTILSKLHDAMSMELSSAVESEEASVASYETFADGASVARSVDVDTSWSDEEVLPLHEEWVRAGVGGESVLRIFGQLAALMASVKAATTLASRWGRVRALLRGRPALAKKWQRDTHSHFA